ncbi:MAG: GNAT family N-acetyltransferase [Bacillota bacterium]|jgi:GNAT superfamily N-acetyltransferase
MSITYGKLDLARDGKQHLELFRAVFGKEMSEELFAWKYQDNPHQVDHEHCMIFVAKDGDRLVGARSLFPGRVFYRDNWYAGAQGGDTMVHPDYRGRGIFTGLLQMSVEELSQRQINVLYNFPNQNSLPGNLSQGARKERDIVTAVRVLNLSKAFKREKRPRYAAPVLPVSQVVPAAKGYSLTVETAPSPHIDALFFQTFSGTDLVAQDRTHGHLEWRFAKYPNPHKTYRFMHLWHGDGLVGYAVLSLSGNGVGEVADYLVLNHDRRLFAHLLDGALQWYRNHRASHLKIWYSHPAHKWTLSSRAFLPKRLSITFVTRYLSPVSLEQAPWYITMGDTDTF